MQEYILETRNLSKYYAGVRALDDVSVGFHEGEVHALVGENGAGKSTLIKTLTGAIEPTHGNIILEGETFSKLDPIEAINRGISAVYQEFNLVPFLSVAENIFLGKEIKNGVFINKKKMNAAVKQTFDEMGVELNPASRVETLGVAYQQIVEIVKAISFNSRILILDEPTASLTNNETALLFKIVKKLKANGVTIIFITHRLEELFEICDRVTIMRDGRHIITADTKDFDRGRIISHMVGRELGEKYPEKRKESGEEVLRCEGLRNYNINGVSFSLHRGEIVGFGGLVGAGRTEVMQALFGADRLESGDVWLNGRKLKVGGPKDALKKGIGLIPEDRKNQGVLLELSVRHNITFSSLERVKMGPFISNKKDVALTEEYVDKLRVKTPRISQLVKNLSGGNQQKVVLAKMLATDCDVLIFDEPTRGIDVGAKQEIYILMRKLADDEGKSIIMVSSDMPELIGMSDRILIMRNGTIVGQLQKKEFSQELILEYASGLIGGQIG